MHGARKNHDPSTNAQPHTLKANVQSLDIANFYPSIRPNHVFNTFKRLKCSSAIATLLKKLCTTDNHVPQGYNTSPNIANLVLVPAANRIARLCKEQGLSATIYIDDITLSSNKSPEKYIKTIEKIINECGFNLKPEKSICMKSHEKQKVTGIVVNKKLNFDKAEYKDLSAKIHICTTHGFSTLVGHLRNKKGELIDTTVKLKYHLAGRLSHLNRINPSRIKKLKEKFESIKWIAV